MDESDFGSTVYGIIGRSFLENGGDLSGGPDLVHLKERSAVRSLRAPARGPSPAVAAASYIHLPGGWPSRPTKLIEHKLDCSLKGRHQPVVTRMCPPGDPLQRLATGGPWAAWDYHLLCGGKLMCDEWVSSETVSKCC